MVRVSNLNATLQTDAGGATTLTVQSAALVVPGQIGAPMFSGQPLGLADRAAFQAEMRFRDTDVASPSAIDVQLQVTVANTDSASDHDITSFNCKLAIEIATFDAPVYADGLIGIQGN